MAIRTTGSVQTEVGDFYMWMAAAIALFAFAAFAPTYWLQIPAGTFVGTPLVHIHSAVFTAWALFLVWQSYLAANGRIKRHRAWGYGSIQFYRGNDQYGALRRFFRRGDGQCQAL